MHKMVGAGGVFKRTADSLVAHGKDIPNAHTLYKSLKPATSVHLIEMKEEEIKKFYDETPADLITVTGMMKIHQVSHL